MTQPSRDITVVVVDDDPRVRDALELLIDRTRGMICVRTFADVQSMLEEDIEATVDVVLLDIGFPGTSGLTAIAPLRARLLPPEILMLTVCDEEDVVFDALCEGASGYLLKNTPPSDILAAIRDVHTGGAPITASIARKVVSYFRRPSFKQKVLSERENEVLALLMDGKTNRQIGEELFISANTVAYHLKQVYEKLHVHSRAEAVAIAMHQARTLE